MAWEPYLLEARLALDEVRHRQFPAIACDALEAGLDGKTIRRVAGLIDPTSFEVAQLRPEFMREAGLQTISCEQALGRLAAAESNAKD
jgi:hypothetical protein